MGRKALLAVGASLVCFVALVACGDERHAVVPEVTEVDRKSPPPTLDAGPEAGTGMPANAVRVAVTGDAVADVPVVFGDADGNVLEILRTGADGTATSHVEGIAMVTAAQSRAKQRRLTTWVGVKVGEVLTLASFRPWRGTTYGDLALTVPSRNGYGSSPVAVAGSCRGQRAPVEGTYLVPLGGHCIQAAPVAVLVENVTDGGELVHAFTMADAPSPTDGSTVSLPELSAYRRASKAELSVTNADAETSVYACVSAVHGGLAFRQTCASVHGASVSLDYPTGFGQAVQAQVGAGGDYRMTRTITKRAARGQPFTFDATEFLPGIDDVRWSMAGPLRPTASWVSDTTTASGGIVAVLFVADGEPGTWAFIVPPGTQSVKAPALGAGTIFSDDAWLSIGGQPPDPVEIAFYEGSAFADAAAFRQRQGLFFADAASLSEPPALGTDGEHLRMTHYRRSAAH